MGCNATWRGFNAKFGLSQVFEHCSASGALGRRGKDARNCEGQFKGTKLQVHHRDFTCILHLYMTYLIWRTCLQLQHLQRCKVILMASNCWLAEQNLAHQPRLNNSKILLAEKYQILGQMVSSMRRKQRRLGKFSEWWDYACNMMFFSTVQLM